MKSYTDLEQSKKLAETLPLESADYCWGIDDETLHYNNSPYPCAWKDYTCKEYYIPCWSLVALLDILPDRTCVYKKTCKDGRVKYKGVAKGIKELILKDNPIDACVAMIEKLHELKML